MTLVEHNGLVEWMLADGRLVDPMKRESGLCPILECLEPAGPGGMEFCPRCAHGNT